MFPKLKKTKKTNPITLFKVTYLTPFSATRLHNQTSVSDKLPVEGNSKVYLC